MAVTNRTNLGGEAPPIDWYNQVLCGDCVELMQRMPADFVDCVITSPPYRG